MRKSDEKSVYEAWESQIGPLSSHTDDSDFSRSAVPRSSRTEVLVDESNAWRTVRVQMSRWFHAPRAMTALRNTWGRVPKQKAGID